VNARTKDLARIAASVARESTSRASRVNGNEAQRNPSHSVRARLHAATTVGLAIAVAVLAFKFTEERDLRRRVDAHVEKIAAARPPNIGAEQQPARWALRAALAARIGSTGSGPTQVAALTTAGTPSVVRDRDFQQQLRHQLSDPALRSALRGQQRGAVLQLYGDLLRSWHLSADKSDRVLDLLAEQQLQEIEQSLNASGPGSAGAARASTDAAASANADELNAVLTDQQRKELQRQQGSLSERLTVGSLADELSLAQMPLTDAQREQLTQVMVDERKAVAVPDLSGLPANSPDAQRMLEDWQSALDQRVQDRAATVLTSDQQTRFEQFMSRQREARNAFAAFNVVETGDNAGGGGGETPPGATVPPQGP
jgi:hypothetical protein